MGDPKSSKSKAPFQSDIARRVTETFARLRLNAADIKAAYHIEIDGYRTSTDVSELEDRFVVESRIVSELNPNSIFASFRRTIFRSERPLRVTHDHLEVREDQRYRGFGRELLRSELRFYKRVGTRHVDLDAADDGILIWPRYDWRPFDRSASPPECGRAIVEQRVRAVIRRYAGSSLEQTDLPRLGPDILALTLFSFSNDSGTRELVLRPDTGERGIAVGLTALRELKQEETLVPMRLDLEDAKTLFILQAKGILTEGAS